MSCRDDNPTFRLLDAFVGWEAEAEADAYKNLTGLDEATGVRLKLKDDAAVDPAQVLACIPPPRLARGCGPCEWYLITPRAPRLLRRGLTFKRWRIAADDCQVEEDPCGEDCTRQWLPVWEYCAPDCLVNAIAVAAWRHRIAVADGGAGTVWVWTQSGARLSASINVAHPGPVAFTPHGQLLVVDKDAAVVLRFSPSGDALGKLKAKIPTATAQGIQVTVDRMAVSSDQSVWLVTRSQDGSLQLWRAARGARAFEPSTVEQLANAFKPTGVVAASELGFCIEERGDDGFPVTCCYSWYGRCVDESKIETPHPPARFDKGQLLTAAIDSGRPRCQWHRVRVDADVPPGTSISFAVATSEIEGGVNQPPSDAEWMDFPAGVPHPTDWQIAPGGSLDFLINQPPGRYLYFRMRLRGDGVATPVVRRVRLDFPRVTSADFLPAVYLENPIAEDFTERFLSLFDATIEEIDRAIERFPALLDSDSVPDEVLPWIGSFLDLAFDRAWDGGKRRKILKALPELYRLRGTVAGLKRAISLVFDVDDPVIQELAAERAWGALHRETVLGAVRLFGRSRARFRLDSSPLSAAPIRRYGNPDEDPLTSHAYRFRVLVPPSRFGSAIERERLERLIASQKPAHTVASIRVGGTGLVLGYWSSVGVDTAFAALPAPVLGSAGNVRLGRMTILWPGRRGPTDAMLLGRTTEVGLRTVME
jgi:phage tail-like protein